MKTEIPPQIDLRFNAIQMIILAGFKNKIDRLIPKM